MPQHNSQLHTTQQREEELEAQPAAMQLEQLTTPLEPSTAAAPPPSNHTVSAAPIAKQSTVINPAADNAVGSAASAGSNRNLKGSDSESTAEPSDGSVRLSGARQSLLRMLIAKGSVVGADEWSAVPIAAFTFDPS